MSYFYPQCAVKLRILLEDFQLVSNAAAQVPYEIHVVPKNITVDQNDYKTASTFTMELDYNSFPFDPRAIRYCGVVIYAQDMRALQKSDGSPNTLVPGAPTLVDPTVTNAIFAGFVDEESVSFDDSKRAVTFTGRDFTTLLIDQKYDEKNPIALTAPIDKLLKTYLSKFKATAELKVVNKTKLSVLPTLASYAPGFGNSKLAGQKNAGAHESYWEIIQDIVNRAGLICYIHLDQLILTTPRNLHSDANDLKFVYGQNIKMLTYKRKLGRYKNFNIVVRCLSNTKKNVLEARIPKEATDAWCKSYGIPKKDVFVPVLTPAGVVDPSAQSTPAPAIAFPVQSVADKAALIRIGQTVYEEYSLQQLEGSFETHEMLAHSGDTQNGKDSQIAYDLTQLRIGQPVALEIETDDLNKISRLSSINDRVQYLLRKGFDFQVASIFAVTMGKFSQRFYTKSYSMTFNNDSGFKLRVEFINIIDLSNRGIS